MGGFTKKIVDLMKSNKFASQGLFTGFFGFTRKMMLLQCVESNGRIYKENDVLDPVINTCNGFYCDKFVPNRPYKPLMWTEAWSGWFTDFGGPTYQRPVQDLAFVVGRFIQRGGSFINYYMYHGGTNFSRSARDPFITTSYDYNAPLDEYGLPKQPKYDHL